MFGWLPTPQPRLCPALAALPAEPLWLIPAEPCGLSNGFCCILLPFQIFLREWDVPSAGQSGCVCNSAAPSAAPMGARHPPAAGRDGRGARLAAPGPGRGPSCALQGSPCPGCGPEPPALGAGRPAGPLRPKAFHDGTAAGAGALALPALRSSARTRRRAGTGRIYFPVLQPPQRALKLLPCFFLISSPILHSQFLLTPHCPSQRAASQVRAGGLDIADGAQKSSCWQEQAGLGEIAAVIPWGLLWALLAKAGLRISRGKHCYRHCSPEGK